MGFVKSVNFTGDPNSVVEHSRRSDDETDEVAIVATGSAGELCAGHTCTPLVWPLPERRLTATSTKVHATLALVPTSGDGASSGLPSREEGQAACLPEEEVAADCQQLDGTADLIDKPAAMPTTTEVHTTLTLAPTSGDGASRGLLPRKGGRAALFDCLPGEEVAADC